MSKEADTAKDSSEINFFLKPRKGEWLPDGQTEIPVHRLPKEKKYINAREIRSSTEQVSRKLKYLYTDHNARPHTFTKRLSGRQCEHELASILCRPHPESTGKTFREHSAISTGTAEARATDGKLSHIPDHITRRNNSLFS